jgi:hypothetical protein
MIASLEKTSGRTLLGNELSAYSFYEILANENKKGYLTFDEMKELMHSWRFDYVEKPEDFLNTFRTTLAFVPGEINHKHLEDGTQVFRFDLAR